MPTFPGFTTFGAVATKLISLAGVAIFIALAWILSENRKLFPWRTVLCGLGLQVGFALFILKTPLGAGLFGFLQHGFNKLSDFANEGAKLVFGPLADSGIMAEKFGGAHAFLFAISISSSIIVVSSFSCFLYHYGILQKAVHLMAVVMQRTMRTSGSESLAAAVNIFVGQTESALVIKLYLAGMTASEILALMTVGMATIASGVMVVYSQMGLNAGHLLTASVMSAPGALFMAKIMLPETRPSETAATSKIKTQVHTVNGIDALCRGAGDGIQLAINVLAMLIAFVAAVAMLNFTLGWLQRQCGVHDPVTLQTVLGWLNAPFAFLMGAPWPDCRVFGQLLGERILLNEFYAYLHLSDLVKSHPAALSPRTVTLATYALCGFANFASIAIQIGGISAIEPKRRADLARYGFRSMIGGLLTCYLSAAIAGVIIE